MRPQWRWLRGWPLIPALAATSAGCGGASTASHTPVPPSPTPSAPPPPSLLTVYVHNPVLTHGQPGAWASHYVDPGAVLYHAGQFQMFFDGSASYPAPVGIGYGTSSDGYAWTPRTAVPVLRSQQVAYAKVAIFVTSALVQADGTWVLYFEDVEYLGGCNRDHSSVSLAYGMYAC